MLRAVPCGRTCPRADDPTDRLCPWIVLLTHSARSRITQNPIWTSSIFPLKGPQIVFGCSKTCESDCQSIKNCFTDGLVTQFLLERSPNVPHSQWVPTTVSCTIVGINLQEHQNNRSSLHPLAPCVPVPPSALNRQSSSSDLCCCCDSGTTLSCGLCPRPLRRTQRHLQDVSRQH